MRYGWLKVEFPVRRVMPLKVVTAREFMELYNTADTVSVCQYGKVWDIDDGEVGIYNGHKLILKESIQ